VLKPHEPSLPKPSRRSISACTNAALVAAKARGVKLGRPDHDTDKVLRDRAHRHRNILKLACSLMMLHPSGDDC
jgi:DNA invertase Pin-like site-specific DNA recombinase